MSYKFAVKNLQDKLNQLHFILTEPENRENKEASRAVFNDVFDMLIEALNLYLGKGNSSDKGNSDDILLLSFNQKLFNRQTFLDLKQMAVNRQKNDLNIIYRALIESDARLLQMMADMLHRMGEEYISDE